MSAVITQTFALGVPRVIGAKVLGRWHYDPALGSQGGAFRRTSRSSTAADAVLSGDGPYQLDLPPGWLGYVYPPLLAWLMTPLTLFSVPVAVSVWALLSVLFVVAALWVLGVRIGVAIGRTPVAIQRQRSSLEPSKPFSCSLCPYRGDTRHARASTLAAASRSRSSSMSGRSRCGMA